MEVQTKCEGCIFLNHSGDYEKGLCQLGRYKNFEKNGATIENCVVKGRFCSAKRPAKWAEGKNKINLPLIVRAELLVNYEVIIPIQEFQPESLKRTLDSLNNQLIKPTTVVINAKSENIHYSQLIKFLQSQSLPFRVDRIRSDTHYLEAIDTSVNKAKTDYYLMMHSGDYLEPEYIANIDEAINVDLKRFLIVLGEFPTGNFVSTFLHKHLDGNYPTKAKKFDEECQDENLVLNTFEDKVRYLVEKRGQDYLIKSYLEIADGK